ncbi:MAG: hypothetical protein VX252_11520 [Myxococcota bacterium]|nr:hypothetical protein [Myxococcota bacterium]
MRPFALSFLVLFLLALGCAGSSSTPLLASARERTTTFYVEQHAADNRNIDQIIVEAFRSRAVQATGGPPSGAPPNVNFLVTYEDRWAWDMRTYLRMIQIDVREPGTGAIVATSQSHQDSLSSMGQTYQEIVKRTATALFDDSP